MELKKEWVVEEYEEDGETVKIIDRKFLLLPGCCKESAKDRIRDDRIYV